MIKYYIYIYIYIIKKKKKERKKTLAWPNYFAFGGKVGPCLSV
jgi:hypothetical protein